MRVAKTFGLRHYTYSTIRGDISGGIDDENHHKMYWLPLLLLVPGAFELLEKIALISFIFLQ